MKNILALVVSIVLAQAAGGVGAVFTAPAIPTWYAGLNKPELAPPNWLFAPVWTSLYLLMAVAAWLVWQKGWKKKQVRAALSVYGIQLGLNSLWSVLFFGLRNPGLALVEIVGLWVMIVVTIIRFFKISRLAGWLLVPYIVWVSLAGYLNFSIWWLNK